MRTHSLLLLALTACATANTPPLEATATIVEEPNTPPPPPGPPPPPATLAQEVRETLFGREFVDPYRWLEDDKAPEVHDWMKAQDHFAREQLSQLPRREVLVKRFKELLYAEAISAPEQRGGRLFYTRKAANQEKAVAYWQPAQGGEEKVLLDPNKWSREGTISLGGVWPSWDGKWAVFTQRPNAADEATLRLVQVDSGGWSKTDVIEGAKYATPEWLPDSSGFYYEYVPTDPAIPVADRPGKVEIRFHRLGADPKQDEVVFPAANDPTWLLSSTLSQDGKYLFVTQFRVGNLESVIHWKQLGKDKEFKVLVKGDKTLYGAYEWKDSLYIESSEGQGRGRLYKASVKHPERKAWKEIIPEDPAATQMSTEIVGGVLSVEYLRDAATEIRLFTLDGKPLRTLQLPGVGAASNLVGLPEEDAAFLSFSSFTVPTEILRASIKAAGAPEVWRKVSLPVDPEGYQVEQVRYPSKDGTQIPMFLVHKKGMAKDGKNPALLYGYGGFSIALEPSFSARIIPWLEAGGLYAVPNLRGGSEYGEAWHHAGMLHQKQNVFDDFAAAAQYLVKEGWTRPEKLAIRGASNGGLLVGAAMTEHPELFGAAVCGVPLLDMLRYHLFGSGKTWIPEYGDPAQKDDFEAIAAYSPYQAVKKGTRYPALLMLSADKDDRVDPMHARKFVAAIQAAGSSSPAYLRIEANAGHGGADQIRQAVEENADVYAFLMKVLDVGSPAEPSAPAPAAAAAPQTAKPAGP